MTTPWDAQAWRAPLDRSAFPEREPGPIDLRRFQFQAAASGFGSFMQLPVCLTPADLVAGKVDVAICGVPVDMSAGVRGAALGPRAIRTAERYLPSTLGALMHQHAGINPFEVLRIVDYGDGPVDPDSVENSVGPIRQFIREIAETGARPVILGGDHSIMWPNVAALADVHGPGKIGVVHFDAHADCAPSFLGHLASHGTPVRRLIEDEHLAGRNFIQVGLRGFLPDAELQVWMRDHGLRSHYMAEIERDGFAAVAERAIDEALDGPEFLYISVDIDVLDPAYAPGTGTPEPAGLTTRELFPLIRRLCHETPVIGIEVVEVNPLADPGYTTALNAHRVVLEALTGMALRQLGMPGRHYLDPNTAGPV